MLDPTTSISLMAFDAVAAGLLIYQGDTLVYANRAALDLFTCTTADLQTTLPLPRLTAAGLSTINNPTIDRILSRPDGSTFVATCHVSPYSLSTASPNAEPASIVTICPVRPTETALREANARYETMLDAVPSMVYQLRASAAGELSFDYASTACYELNGVTPEAVKESIAVLPAPHPDELTAYTAAQDESIRTLALFDWQGRFLRHGDPNDIRWFRMVSQPRRLDDGATVWTGVQIDITAQKRVEEALRQANQHYDDLVTSLPGAVFRGRYEAPDKFHFDYISDNVREITGLEAADIIADPDIWKKWVPLADRPMIAQDMELNVKKTIQSNQAISTERRLEVDGEWRWLRTSARFRQLADGTIFITGIQSNVTAQRQAELDLHNSEARYRLLVEGSPDSMTFQDSDLRYTWVKASVMEAVNRISPIGKTDMELLQPADAAFLTDIKQQVISTGEPWRGEFSFMLNDGRHYAAATYIPRYDSAGQIIGLAGYVRDTSHQKQMEQALRDSEERYRLLVEGSPDTMFFQDTNLCYTWFINPARGQYTANDMINKTDQELFQSSDADYITGLKQQVLATGESWHGEIYTDFATGRRYFDAVYRPRRDSHNKIIGLAGYVREITLRKYSEFALRDSQALVNHLTEYAPFMIYLYDVTLNKTLYINKYTADFFKKSIPELIAMGNPVTPDAIHPDDIHIVEHYLLNRGDIADQPILKPLECRIKNAEGEWRWVMVQTQTLTQNDDGSPKMIVSMVIDITERKHAEEIEREHSQLLEVLRDTATLMHNTLDLDEVLDRVLATINRVASFDAANILLIENGSARVARYLGYSTAEVSQIEDQLSQMDHWTFSGSLSSGQLPYSYNDFSEYTETHPLMVPWVRSFLVTPLYAGGKLIGILNLISRTPDFYTPTHAERLQAFANQSAAAIQNAFLHQQSQMLATNTERQRLARELHDSVTQTLFSASMVAQTLPYLWGRDEEMRRGLDELSRLTTGALAEMRTMLVELRPTALETADLADLVSYLLKAMAGRTTIQYDLTIDGNWRPPPTVQIAAYRVVQEALNNVIKHAYATDVSVNIQRKVGTLQITINDNGLGFTMSDISADHFGLDIMNERAADIDAALDIHSKLGQGSTVSFFWSAPPV